MFFLKINLLTEEKAFLGVHFDFNICSCVEVCQFFFLQNLLKYLNYTAIKHPRLFVLVLHHS